MADWILCLQLLERKDYLEQSAPETNLTSEHDKSAVVQYKIKRMCSIRIDSDGVRKNYIHRKERPLGNEANFRACSMYNNRVSSSPSPSARPA